MLCVRWLGAAGLIIRTDERVVLVDPFVSRHSKLELLLSRIAPKQEPVRRLADELDGVDAIFVGHSHYDHLVDVPLVARLTGCPVFGSQSTANVLRSSGIPEDRIHVLQGGENLDLDGYAVDVIPSEHGKSPFFGVPFPGEIPPDPRLPMRANRYRLGKAFQFLFHMDGKRLFQSGSAGFCDEEVRSRRADFAFIALPWWRKRSGFVPKLIGSLKPDIIIPIHYDDMTKSSTSIKGDISGSEPVEFAHQVFLLDPTIEIRFIPVGWDHVLVD